MSFSTIKMCKQQILQNTDKKIVVIKCQTITRCKFSPLKGFTIGCVEWSPDFAPAAGCENHGLFNKTLPMNYYQIPLHYIS